MLVGYLGYVWGSDFPHPFTTWNGGFHKHQKRNWALSHLPLVETNPWAHVLKLRPKIHWNLENKKHIRLNNQKKKKLSGGITDESNSEDVVLGIFANDLKNQQPKHCTGPSLLLCPCQLSSFASTEVTFCERLFCIKYVSCQWMQACISYMQNYLCAVSGLCKNCSPGMVDFQWKSNRFLSALLLYPIAMPQQICQTCCAQLVGRLWGWNPFPI